MDFRFIKPNGKPTAENPAMIPLIPQVPFDENHCGDFWRHMSGRNDWDESIPVPVISVALIRRFLASVRAFSVLGLEAQATAFFLWKRWSDKVPRHPASIEYPNERHKQGLRCH